MTSDEHTTNGTSSEGGDPPCWAHLLASTSAPTPVMLASLVHDLADAVVICDRDGDIILWNDAATRLFGWAAAEVVGTSLDIIIPERLRDRHWTGYRTVMATGETAYGTKLLEVPGQHRDGTKLSIAFTVTLLTDPDNGTCTGIAAVIRDDTEAWQQRRALRTELTELRAAHPA